MPDYIPFFVIPSLFLLLDAGNIQSPQVKQTYFIINLLHAKPFGCLSGAICSSVSAEPKLP